MKIEIALAYSMVRVFVGGEVCFCMPCVLYDASHGLLT